MYAVPARKDGKKLPLDVPCLECGGRLFFSFDEVSGDATHRYVSCEKKHTSFWTSSTSITVPIEVDEVGFIIENDAPGWEEQIPDWAR